MLLPQMAIFAQGTRAHYFLEFDVLPDVSPSHAVSAFARLRAPEASSSATAAWPQTGCCPLPTCSRRFIIER